MNSISHHHHIIYHHSIHHPPTSLISSFLRSSLWELIHGEDRNKLANVLGRMILTKTDPLYHIPVRLKTAFDNHVSFRAGLRCGMQGIHCTMWPTLPWDEMK